MSSVPSPAEPARHRTRRRRPPVARATVRLAQLKLDELIGKGSRGQIFSAHDATGRAFAVKVMPRHDSDSVVEAACLSRVSNGHPNIIAVEGGGVENSNDSSFLVLERCDTDLLELVLATDGGLDEVVAARLYAQVVRAVRHCHRRGVFHGDIKPENALLLMEPRNPAAGAPPVTAAAAPAAGDSLDASDAVVKLCDFGSASLQRTTTKAAGSVPYAAPEVLPLFHCNAAEEGGAPAPAAGNGAAAEKLPALHLDGPHPQIAPAPPPNTTTGVAVVREPSSGVVDSRRRSVAEARPAPARAAQAVAADPEPWGWEGGFPAAGADADDAWQTEWGGGADESQRGSARVVGSGGGAATGATAPH